MVRVVLRRDLRRREFETEPARDSIPTKAQTPARYILVSHSLEDPKSALGRFANKVQACRVVPREHRIGTRWCPRKRREEDLIRSSSCRDGTTIRSWFTSIGPQFSQTLRHAHMEKPRIPPVHYFPSSSCGRDRSPYQAGPSGGPGLLWHPGSWPWA